MKNKMERVVIVGAGQAGAMAASSLRSFGFEGEITMFGAEAELPYERPELSKAYLSGGTDFEKLCVLSPTQLADLRITLRSNETVSELHIDRKQVVTSIGGAVGYDHVILATGGAPRVLDGCLALRTRADADEIKQRLEGLGSLGIVGAGWLGMELAAHARSSGIDTTVYEVGDTVCGRVLPRDVSEHLAEYHRSTGVVLSLGSAPNLGQVHASHGLTIACIGMSAHDSLARLAGIDTDDGVLVDDCQCSSASGVYAIGDCARPRGGNRIESWAYANRSAKRAAAAITGADVGTEEPLWFWSKQGTQSLQMIGAWGDDMDVTFETAPNGGKVWRYEQAGALAGLIAINSPRDFAKARRVFQ